MCAAISRPDQCDSPVSTGGLHRESARIRDRTNGDTAHGQRLWVGPVTRRDPQFVPVDPLIDRRSGHRCQHRDVFLRAMLRMPQHVRHRRRHVRDIEQGTHLGLLVRRQLHPPSQQHRVWSIKLGPWTRPPHHGKVIQARR